uniref:Uncharacterized protein n=1 Tax=viral metagenome TaxID=1070528 RepID=A0A6M3J9Q8_9ZZZZ
MVLSFSDLLESYFQSLDQQRRQGPAGRRILEVAEETLTPEEFVEFLREIENEDY